ncbi:MAG: hypothetical protein U0359_18920 [Byssovorax sp.]
MSMTIKTTLTLLLAATLCAGCGKKDDGGAAPAGTDQGAAAPGSTGAAAAPANGEVASYPGQVQQGGTVRLLQPFTVHQAADINSPVLSHVGVGQWINLKASYSNWMLIEWPSGVGQMSPGWIELRGISDPRVQVTAAPTVTAPPVVTLPVTANPTATATTTGAKRPTLVIKPRK